MGSYHKSRTKSHDGLLIHTAVTNNDHFLVKHLISSGHSVNYVKNGEAPIHIASRCGYTNIVQSLAEVSQCNLGKRNSRHVSALHMAIANDHLGVVKVLLSKGAPVDLPAVKTAILAGKLDFINELSDWFDIDSYLPCQHTALTLAVSVGSLQIVSELLDCGCDPDKPDLTNRTPAGLAVQSGYQKILEIILEAGADVNIPSFQDGSYKSLLHIATIKGDISVIKLLIAHDCNIDFQTESGESCLHIAAGVGNLEIVNVLLEAGASPDLTLINVEETPLFSAICKAPEVSGITVCKALVQGGCNINHINSRNQTAVQVAVDLERSQILHMLLLADCSLRYGTWMTRELDVYIICKDFGRPDILQLFCQIIRHPLSLQQLCRRSLSTAIGVPYFRAVELLPLPTSQKEFLLYPELDIFSN